MREDRGAGPSGLFALILVLLMLAAFVWGLDNFIRYN